MDRPTDKGSPGSLLSDQMGLGAATSSTGAAGPSAGLRSLGTARSWRGPGWSANRFSNVPAGSIPDTTAGAISSSAACPPMDSAASPDPGLSVCPVASPRRVGTTKGSGRGAGPPRSPAKLGTPERCYRAGSAAVVGTSPAAGDVSASPRSDPGPNSGGTGLAAQSQMWKFQALLIITILYCFFYCSD